MSPFNLFLRSLLSIFSAENSRSTLTCVTGIVASRRETSWRSSGYELIASNKSFTFFIRERSVLRMFKAALMLLLVEARGPSSAVLLPLPVLLLSLLPLPTLLSRPLDAVLARNQKVTLTTLYF